MLEQSFLNRKHLFAGAGIVTILIIFSAVSLSKMDSSPSRMLNKSVISLRGDYYKGKLTVEGVPSLNKPGVALFQWRIGTGGVS